MHSEPSSKISLHPPLGPPPRVHGHDWRAWARRRWPVIAGVLAALLVLVWLVARRGGDRAGAVASERAVAGTAKKAAIDSVVTLDTASLRLAGIEWAPVTVTGAGGLVANGIITYDANRVSVLAPRTESRVVAVQADLGQQVVAGTVLALLESAEVGQTRGELERARVNVDVTRQNYERERRLFEQSISSQKEMLETQAAFRLAEADYTSARSKLRSVGAGGGMGGAFGLATPIAGTVVERNAMPGQIAGPTTNLFRVADLRHVWIIVDVYEADVGRVRQGAAATVNARGLPGESFRGRVTYAGGVVDSASRTLKVRVEVDNTSRRLRPGMFAEVRIETAAGSSRPSASGGTSSSVATVVVPELAVQDLNGTAVVFVSGRAPGQFIVRHVAVVSRAGGMATIGAGLRPGDRVVVKGAFQLKSELTKGSFAGDES